MNLYTKIATSFALAAITLTSPSKASADIDLYATLHNEISFTGTGPGPFGPTPVSYASVFSTGLDVFDAPFETNFAELGDTTLNIHLRSPSGRFYVDYSSALDEFGFPIEIGNLTAMITISTPPAVPDFSLDSFTGDTSVTINDIQNELEEPMPFNVHADLYQSTIDAMQIDLQYDTTFSGAFSFESLTVSINIPEEFNADFSNGIPLDVYAEIGASREQAIGDHGQFLSALPVPEPASISLLALATLPLLTRRR
ncbi:hypothetical protein JD969_08265 [Planctomycetota bacterium]|nr:hypothetical protein JD969_08265 [Planctomycetota bacterium]